MPRDDRPYSYVANHGMMKRLNISSFKQALRRFAPISRADVSRLTGLDKKCISMFSNELIADGFIQEVGIKSTLRGRPSALLDFVPERFYSIGLAVQADRVNAALFEFPGKVTETAVYPLSYDASRDDVLHVLRRSAKDMARHVKRIYGVGVTFPGSMDLREGLIHTAANLPCLNKFHFREAFDDFDFGPIFFEQSARAAALAEYWFGQGRNGGNCAIIELNVGIAMVMVNDNGLCYSPEGFIGELGHVIVQPMGRKCRCGNRGCLEAYLGEDALKERMRESGLAPEELFMSAWRPSEGDYKKWQMRRAESAMQAQANPKARSILRNAGLWLGRALGTVVNLYSPDSIVIFGEIMQHEEILLPHVKKELARSCLPEKMLRTKVGTSRLSMTDAMGAAALAFPGWFESGENSGRDRM